MSTWKFLLAYERLATESVNLFENLLIIYTLLINFWLFRFISNNLVGCSHGRAHEFFLESLLNDFLSVQCSSFKELRLNQCTMTGVVAKMGGDIDLTIRQPTGIFYLETNNESPYAIADVNRFCKIKVMEPQNWSRRLLSTPVKLFRRIFGQ